MSSVSRYAGRGPIVRRSKEDWYVIVVAKIPLSIDWQEFKDAVRATGATRVRRAAIETKQDVGRIGHCEVEGRDSAERAYEQFKSAGLAGCSISVSLMREGASGRPLKGPAQSPIPKKPAYAGSRRASGLSTPASLAPTPLSGAATPSYNHYMISGGSRPLALPGPSWRSPITNMPTQSGRSLQTRLNSTQSVEADTSTAPSPSYYSPVDTGPKSVIIQDAPHRYQARDIKKLLAEHFRLSGVCEMVNDSTIRATFLTTNEAQLACRRLNECTVNKRKLRARLEQSVGGGTSRPQQSAGAKPFAPRPQAPEFNPAKMWMTPDGPLVVDGSQHSTRRCSASFDSDDD